jgi:pilus assembly protein FimV
MSPRLSSIASCFCLIGFSLSAHALTLAGIEVKSFKGEALRAEISVIQTSAEEWSELSVKIAAAERFTQLGLIYTPAVGQLNARLIETPQGLKRIQISGPQNFSDNFVDVLLEAQTPSSTWVKAFTLMLKDPPTQTQVTAQLPISAASQLKITIPSPAEHIVQRGENASQIIQQWLKEDMSTQQMLVALLKNQPDAFIEGNVNLLRAGATLKAPTSTAVRAIHPEDARLFLVAQQKEFLAYSQATAQNTSLIKGQHSTRQISGKVGREDSAPKETDVTTDQLRLTQAKIEKQNAETRLAAQRALQEAQKQLEALQSNVNQLVKLTSPTPALPIQTQTQIKAQSQSSDLAPGWLNLNRLLDSQNRNAYLWAALTLLGVLTVWAGLKIQSRKANQALSTLIPTALNSGMTLADRNDKLELPAEITALNLNLGINSHPTEFQKSFRSPSHTETRQ